MGGLAHSKHIAKEALYLRSGHLPYYAGEMYAPMEREESRDYLRPMNCPFHHKIYASKSRSYRDLPLRLADYGMVYRYEQSGSFTLRPDIHKSSWRIRNALVYTLYAARKPRALHRVLDRALSR